jgi:hypothetical protein
MMRSTNLLRFTTDSGLSNLLNPTDNQAYVELPFLEIPANQNLVILSSIVFIVTILLLVIPWGIYLVVSRFRRPAGNDQNNNTNIPDQTVNKQPSLPLNNITRINVQVPPRSAQSNEP